MIAQSKPRPTPDWHKQYMTMLPAILRHARLAFRHLDHESRAEAMQEVVAHTFLAFARLVERGMSDLAYAGPLAGYAVAQFRGGRRVGCRVNVRDVLNPRCQQVKGVMVERLDRYHRPNECWLEAVVEDHRTSPADQAAFRIDFPAWLGRLSARNRKIAETLAAGESTGKVARQFGLSIGRISQLRRELEHSWRSFHGEAA